VFFDPSWPRRAAREVLPATPVPRWVAPALAGWFAVQLLLPVRHLAYPGDVRWTEEGFRFSWRVLLVEKRGYFRYRLEDPATGRRWTISPREELTERQLHQASSSPDMLLQYAHRLRDRFRAEGHPDIAVYCDAWVSMNGQPSQRLIDPAVDLARERRWTLSGWRWILPAASPGGVVSTADGP
jgi:vitamin K-dependent gamma-carboxylase